MRRGHYLKSFHESNTNQIRWKYDRRSYFTPHITYQFDHSAQYISPEKLGWFLKMAIRNSEKETTCIANYNIVDYPTTQSNSQLGVLPIAALRVTLLTNI